MTWVRFPCSRVISLTSANGAYQGHQRKKLPDIARELAVDWVVEGGVLREGQKPGAYQRAVDRCPDRFGPVWAHNLCPRTWTSDLALQGEVAPKTICRRDPAPMWKAAGAGAPRPRAPQSIRRAPGSVPARNPSCGKRTICKKCCRSISVRANREEAQAMRKRHSALASCYGRMGEIGPHAL